MNSKHFSPQLVSLLYMCCVNYTRAHYSSREQPRTEVMLHQEGLSSYHTDDRITPVSARFLLSLDILVLLWYPP